MQQIKTYCNTYLKDKSLVISTIISLIFLGLSILINFYAGQYTEKSVSNSVTDIILSNIPVYNLGWAFVYGSIIFFFIIVFVCVHKPNRIPFTLKSLSLFIVIRSLFTTLTHLGPFPSQAVIHSDILSKLTFGSDLFFSGHTGMPFLLALIFWSNKNIRNVFLGFSLAFALIVLLAHLHYTIDVLSAFFITYTIFHIAEYLFKKDRKRFN